MCFSAVNVHFSCCWTTYSSKMIYTILIVAGVNAVSAGRANARLPLHRAAPFCLAPLSMNNQEELVDTILAGEDSAQWC